ncbi:MAG TPA: hypothetical protein PLI65_00695 [Bacteroidales bacterium]|nr:hypothetical protein [Bacteroidales bacterium]HRW97050.1 hypothetical protein [Bacteroidales bacterium]
MTTLTLGKIEELVYRSTYNHEFLEEEIISMLEPLFNAPSQLTSQHYTDIIRLLFMISHMNKSSNFGYYFYEKLHENPFPFCEEILKSAVLTEKYYNLHDKALKSYVRSYLIKNGVEPVDILTFDKIIPEGHGMHFMSACQSIKYKWIELKHTLKPDFFNILYLSINNDHFPMTQKKLACILSYLRMECFVPALIGKSLNLINVQELNAERILVLIHFLQSISFLTEKSLSAPVEEAVEKLAECTFHSDVVENFYPFKQMFISYLNEQKNMAIVSC